jgi:DNA-binding transcriptional LysR family regulator
MPKPARCIPRLGKDGNGVATFSSLPAKATEGRQEQKNAAALPDWDDLRVLLSVVQTGSFSRTAKELDLTQPTVSRRVARLEKMVGAQLVDRSNNGVVLTLEGHKVIDELHVAHSAIHRAVNRTHSHTMHGEPVSLFTTDGILTYWMSYFLPFLYQHHPWLDVRASISTDPGILERARFDLSIHYSLPNNPNLLTTRLGTLHFMPFASPGYIARYGRPRRAEDLAHHRLLDYALYLIDKGTWMTRLPSMAREARASFFTNSSPALAECVRHDGGIALLPTYTLVFEKGFEPLSLGLNFATPFWICYPMEALAKESVRVTIDFLKHIFDRRAMPWFADDFVAPERFPATTPGDVMASYPAGDVVAKVTGGG